ncbi:MAG TPA: PEP-CTERM sorting domain-containing protein [Gemmataceae bacterium]|nr:PEP-CTERM sorting domain-containing protein [Gemmataceae bacterium]
MRIATAVGLLALAIGCVNQANAGPIVAVIGSNSNATITSYLNSNGFTATNFGNSIPGSLAGFDAVVLLRTPGNATVQNFVLGGGKLVTEWDASVWALNTAGLLNATDSGGGFVGTSTPVTFTPDGVADGLSTGLSNPYSNTGATEFFRDLTGIGAGVDILATRPGGFPVIIGGQSGNGSTVVIGYDWADIGDQNATIALSGQLLVNALNFDPNAVPEPATLTLFGVLMIGGACGWCRRKRPVAA